MAVNKPVGGSARKGAVKKRSQLKNPVTKTATKRNKKGSEFMAVKKSAKNSRAFVARNNSVDVGLIDAVLFPLTFARRTGTALTTVGNS